MAYLLPIFKAVNVIFAVLAVTTGAQALVDPIGFSRSFGLALNSPTTDSVGTSIDNEDAVKAILHHQRSLTMSYISLMGVRQLTTGIILLTFAYQEKWTEAASILAIIGIVVAGTDGIYLSRGAGRSFGLFHAIPGACIAALAWAVISSNS